MCPCVCLFLDIACAHCALWVIKDEFNTSSAWYFFKFAADPFTQQSNCCFVLGSRSRKINKLFRPRKNFFSKGRREVFSYPSVFRSFLSFLLKWVNELSMLPKPAPVFVYSSHSLLIPSVVSFLWLINVALWWTMASRCVTGHYSVLILTRQWPLSSCCLPWLSLSSLCVRLLSCWLLKNDCPRTCSLNSFFSVFLLW